jgi:hypothetical protein
MPNALARWILVLASGVSVAAPVAADELEDVSAVAFRLRGYQRAIRSAKVSASDATDDFKDEVDSCRAAIARGNQLGLKPTDTIDGDDDVTVLWKNAGKICDEYQYWQRLAAAADVLQRAHSASTLPFALEPGDVDKNWIDGTRSNGIECQKQVDTLVASGAPADVPFNMMGEVQTLSAGRDKYCGALIRWADKFGADTATFEAAAAAEAAAIYEASRRKWSAAKMTGDRLKTFIEFDGDAWFVGRRGGCQELVAPGQLKKAKVLFRWLSGGDWSHTLVRYQFRGDQLASTSERTYDSRGQASAGCR